MSVFLAEGEGRSDPVGLFDIACSTPPDAAPGSSCMPAIKKARAPDEDGSAVAPLFFEENAGLFDMAVFANAAVF